MSWFNYVSQSSSQHQPTDNQGIAGILCSSPNPVFTCPASFPSPSLGEFPPAPQGVVSPPSLEKLSCASPSAGQVREPEPISYVTFQEQRCVLSWFQSWTPVQRERFLQDLLGKAVPGKVCTLLDSLSTLQVKDKLPNIFECQLRLWTQWFESWGEEERNHFLHMLEERDPDFVTHFYRSVAGTAGRD
ncbi:uncharacterized protein C14orf119 homolog [Maylandia zebra]|uniref:Chromosome 14 open reading frame 119 n=1 Tax=Maylandia zebra TaxID=106582 RepID=A0A3P9C243_9CICH|nr:uncharacterized protein C14orf119 homolog [Maylandia zebra]